MRPLNWKAPADYTKAFLEDGEIFENFCNTSLTNLHSDCFLPFAQKFNVQAKKNPTDAPFWFFCEVSIQ